jgi:hypothetical protein
MDATQDEAVKEARAEYVFKKPKNKSMKTKNSANDESNVCTSVAKETLLTPTR